METVLLLGNGCHLSKYFIQPNKIRETNNQLLLTIFLELLLIRKLEMVTATIAAFPSVISVLTTSHSGNKLRIPV